MGPFAVRMRYADWQGELSEREVDPYGIAYVSGRWFTVGWCHLRQDLRMFRLDRVRACEPLSAEFAPPENFDALAYVQRSLALSPACWEIEVRLNLPLAEAAARVPPAFADLAPDAQDPDGHSRLRCTANDLDFVARELMNLCCGIEIGAPPALADAFTRLAERATQIATGVAGDKSE